jgi:IS605 OrfB family transposase
MMIQKTIKARIFALTNIKNQKLSREYMNFQLALRGGSRVRLYAATAQQAQRVRGKIFGNGGRQIREDHPLIIRRDCFKVQRQDGTKLTKWWAKVPVYGGSIWVPIQLPNNQESLLDYGTRETKLLKHGTAWFLHIAIQKEVSVEIPHYSSRIAVIGVDLGEANPVTSVVLAGGKITKPNFHATWVRGVRAHYSNLRKQIGRKKVKHGRRIVRRIGNKEQRIVDYHLHVASKAIVQQAEGLKNCGFAPVIAIGDIRDVRKRRKRGEPSCRKNNRKIHMMPSYKAKRYIWYKAMWAGVPVVLVGEAYTSVPCHRCGATGITKKRLFVCPECGVHCDRDLNAAINIGNRFLDYMLRNSGALTHRTTPTLYRVAGQSSEHVMKKVSDGRIPKLTVRGECQQVI